MRTAISAAIAATAVGVILSGCGAAPVAQTSVSPMSAVSTQPTTPAVEVSALPTAEAVTHTPVAAASPQPSPAAQPCTVPQPLPNLCVGRAATDEERKAIIAGAEAQLYGEFAWKDCSESTSMQAVCFKVGGPPVMIVGTNAAVFAGESLYTADRTRAFYCVIFAVKQTTWFGLAPWCVKDPSTLPGALTRVEVGASCANVRSTPGITGKVVSCLRSDTDVKVDSAPTYSDGYMWWHLAGRGWIAHDFLYAPSHAS